MEPDGKIVVTYSKPHFPMGEKETFLHKNTRGVRATPHGLIVLTTPDITIPWHNILRTENYHNSPEFVEYLQDQPDTETYEPSKNCMACYARLDSHQIHMMFLGHRAQEIGFGLGLNDH